ncbi:MAG: hypothetical protein LUO79_04595 [Methanomassiliicoccales archaeon]|nr:hypothetical protein [Methanomassiliicoccales archaeon]
MSKEDVSKRKGKHDSVWRLPDIRISWTDELLIVLGVLLLTVSGVLFWGLGVADSYYVVVIPFMVGVYVTLMAAYRISRTAIIRHTNALLAITIILGLVALITSAYFPYDSLYDYQRPWIGSIWALYMPAIYAVVMMITVTSLMRVAEFTPDGRAFVFLVGMPVALFVFIVGLGNPFSPKGFEIMFLGMLLPVLVWSGVMEAASERWNGMRARERIGVIGAAAGGSLALVFLMVGVPYLFVMGFS